uniref:Phosphoglycolate phosphatase n=1 Tax=Ascaris lumbricoides TaxID=6252 RepID=A0A0M3HS85_ASCLU
MQPLSDQLCGCVMFARDRVGLLKCFAAKECVRQLRVSATRKNDSANQRPSTASNENNYIPMKAAQPQTTICNVCNATIIHKWQYCQFPRELDSTSFAELLPDIDTFIFDADGVLWLGETPIVGSPEFFEYLTKQNKQIIVLTNNSNRSRRALLAKMRKMGFTGTSEEDIVNPAAIIIEYLSSRGFQASGKMVYLIGSQGFREELDEARIMYFGCGPDPPDGMDIDQENLLDKDAFIYRIGLDDPAKEVGAVIVGFEKHFNCVKMMRAANFLQDENCLFLGTNEDETSPGPHPKTVIPDTGPILAAVKMAAGREPIVVGKPHAAAFHFICSKWGIRPHRTMMIGDRSNTDIIFGRRHGMRTTLVLSGVHSLEDVQRNQRAGLVDLLPDYYAPCLGSLVS